MNFGCVGSITLAGVDCENTDPNSIMSLQLVNNNLAGTLSPQLSVLTDLKYDCSRVCCGCYSLIL